MRVNWSWFLALVLMTAIIAPAATYQLSYFGVDLGSVSLGGINLEHEAFGLALLAVSGASFRHNRKLALALAILGGFLVVSELWPGAPLNDLWENPAGAALSFFLGAYYGLVIPRAFPEEAEG